MPVTYRAAPALTRAANRLAKKDGRIGPLAPFILMSDPRLPEITALARALPAHSALIYRHFGAAGRFKTARDLRQICFERGAQLLIGQDTELAIACGADGVHFAQKDMTLATVWRARIPSWILTAATHEADNILKANNLPLDAITLSPLFDSDSPSAGQSLGADRFNALAGKSVHPVIALGGIKTDKIKLLKDCHAAGLAGVSGLIVKA